MSQETTGTKPQGAERGTHDLEPGHMSIDHSHGKVVAETPDSLNGLKVANPEHKAAGLPAVLRATQYVWSKAGVVRGTYALSFLNQKGGIDCMSCAWPDPDGDRSFAEFCENGAKAIGHEADTRKCGPEFFAAHSVAELSTRSDYWLEQQGRLTHPMVLRTGATHYEPISWDDAFGLMASELNKLATPDAASFYTSGRASNEAAFLYQLFVRQFGTNNLPDCSNMCHESSGSALTPTIGIGKGTVTLEDFTMADAIFILGQNPGTNHPRMLTTLEQAKKKGCTIVAINPLPEAGLLGFMNPQKPLGMLGKSTKLADLFLPVKINGDVALLKGIMKEMLEDERRAPGTVFDWNFIRDHTHGVEELIANIEASSWEKIVEDCALSRAQIRAAAEVAIRSQRIIACWAMGLTQHQNAVETIQEIVNLLLLRGSMGKPGAGACPVRGHSNVQGDRTMGIWERPGKEFLDSLQKNFDFEPPRHHGLDVVESIKAMHDGRLKVFIQLGGNFLSATPDTRYVQEGLSKLDLTVRIGTKLNRTDLITGKQALILPCLGRSEIDRRPGGEQFVSSENSMGVVQSSKGRLEPASDELRSEVAIIGGIAQATLDYAPDSVGSTPRTDASASGKAVRSADPTKVNRGTRSNVAWSEFSDDYDHIRDAIARTIKGCENYNQQVRKPGGFYLPNHARNNEYVTATGKANFTVNPIPERHIEPGQLILMTIRSHDQFNTTIYGLHDRYRGIHNERRVIFMNKDDMAERRLETKQTVNITSHFNGQTRHAPHFIIVPYQIPKGCCAVYFPEGNLLVPIGSVAARSNTPVSKYVKVTVEPARIEGKFDYERVDGALKVNE